MLNKFCAVMGVLVVVHLLSGCAPEVGTVAWCHAMDEKPKMDWTARELKDYATHCLDK